MLFPTNTTIAPHLGWSVDLPEFGPTITSNNWQDFLHQIHVRLKANGKDFHNCKEWAVDLMCKQRPDIPSEDDSLPPSRAMTGEDVARFLRTAWSFKEAGMVPVSEELQNHRIDVCMACPKAGFISCFIGCQQITGWIIGLTEGRNLPRREEVGKMACVACGCSILPKTGIPLGVLQDAESKMKVGAAYPPNCWMVTEQANALENVATPDAQTQLG